ncbi:hypothetical protein [Methylomagnum sp.]
MKADRLTKCYAALSLKERAGLVLGYCAAGDELEATRILSTVPVVPCRSTEPEYRQWLERYIRLSAWWGVEHWRTMARRMAALGGGLDETHGPDFMRAARAWESRLMALDVALNDAGARHGFDPDAIRQGTAAEPFRPIAIESPDAGDVAAMNEAVREILGG